MTMQRWFYFLKQNRGASEPISRSRDGDSFWIQGFGWPRARAASCRGCYPFCASTWSGIYVCKANGFCDLCNGCFLLRGISMEPKGDEQKNDCIILCG